MVDASAPLPKPNGTDVVLTIAKRHRALVKT
jgi:hypothetical protein